MTKPEDTSVPLPAADMAKTYRHLRFVKALFEIDDPELERALAVIVDRLARGKRIHRWCVFGGAGGR